MRTHPPSQSLLAGVAGVAVTVSLIGLWWALQTDTRRDVLVTVATVVAAVVGVIALVLAVRRPR